MQESDFKISLAQWSLHKTYFGGPITDWGEFARLIKESPDSVLKGDADPMDFPELAASYGITSIELVNTFYFTKVEDMEYWAAFKKKKGANTTNRNENSSNRKKPSPNMQNKLSRNASFAFNFRPPYIQFSSSLH